MTDTTKIIRDDPTSTTPQGAELRAPRLTDLEMTKLCAEAMGLDTYVYPGDHDEYTGRGIAGSGLPYDPLHDDAQAMALVKKLDLCCTKWNPRGEWSVFQNGGLSVNKFNLNRAICECVAKMQQQRATDKS